MKKVILYIIFGGLILSLGACSNKEKPAIVFMPDMYYPVPYDPYMKANFDYPERLTQSNVPLYAERYDMTTLWPAEGTVPKEELDLLPYEGKNTTEDYRKSFETVVSPLKAEDRDKDLERAKKLYGQLCTTCHGDKGKADGPIVLSTAYSGVPTYAEREMTVGSVHHVITHGLNSMGSYAGQLSPADRWRVAEYVMTLKNNN